MSLFSSAVKALTTGTLSSNYSISPQPTSTAGPWKVHEAKRKSTGQAYSAFIFDRRSLEAGAAGSLRSSSGLKAAQDEVVERLKKEASALARLRHPSILELAEPVEETRTGLMFITEAVAGSLQFMLDNNGALSNEDRGARRRPGRDMEIDELEIQKGLLQVARGLEFLHESAGLVHGNLTPESIFVNAKSDWKLSAFSFSTQHANANNPGGPNVDLIGLAAQHDQRLPSIVQVNLDYASPDIMLDNSITPAGDLFSLGLLIIAIYNSPHESPLKSHNSPTSYKRLFSSSTNIPSTSNNFLCTKPLPKDLVDGVLPRLITRRPVTRLNAREFQEAGYFDNILVSTIRFLDDFPAKSQAEKTTFMRGLPKVLPQFPTNVAQRKVLPMLIEELKDRGELLPFTLAAVLTLIETLAPGNRIIGEKLLPSIRLIFERKDSANAAAPRPGTERDGRDAALAVVLEQLHVLREKCSTSEFKDDIVPLYILALESQVSHLQDLALKSLPQMLPKIDFQTLKNAVFPVVAVVFTKTSSLSIKNSCLEALRVLCGGRAKNEDDLAGKPQGRDEPVALDRYTVQEKVVPLLKGIKTKEPAVMMATLEVYVQIGAQVDATTLATEVIPALWILALGPLLNVEQFQSFMRTLKSFSSRIENEHLRRLQDSSTSTITAPGTPSTFSPHANTAISTTATNGDTFESLVSGKKAPKPVTNDDDDFPDAWDTTIPTVKPTTAPQAKAAFAWSSPSPSTTVNPMAANMSIDSFATLKPQAPMTSRSQTVTPDHSISTFNTLQPSKPGMSLSSSSYNNNMIHNNNNNSTFSEPLRPSIPSSTSFGATTSRSMPTTASTATSANTGIDWTAATMKPSFPSKPIAPPPPPQQQRPQQQSHNQTHPTILYGQTRQQAAPTKTEFSGWSIAPPPIGSTSNSSFSAGIQAPQQNGGFTVNMGMKPMQPKRQVSQTGMNMNLGGNLNSSGSSNVQGNNSGKGGLDAWESLL